LGPLAGSFFGRIFGASNPSLSPDGHRNKDRAFGPTVGNRFGVYQLPPMKSKPNVEMDPPAGAAPNVMTPRLAEFDFPG
jgi:hypothetical protein